MNECGTREEEIVTDDEGSEVPTGKGRRSVTSRSHVRRWGKKEKEGTTEVSQRTESYRGRRLLGTGLERRRGDGCKGSGLRRRGRRTGCRRGLKDPDYTSRPRRGFAKVSLERQSHKTESTSLVVGVGGSTRSVCGTSSETGTMGRRLWVR